MKTPCINISLEEIEKCNRSFDIRSMAKSKTDIGISEDEMNGFFAVAYEKVKNAELN